MKILFVCLGNICRSPTAEAVVRRLLATEAPDLQVQVASAGLGSWHVGEPPDSRAQAAAKRRGVDMSTIRARQVSRDDFARYDLILAMDRQNLVDLQRLAPAGYRERVRLFLEFGAAEEIDDLDEVPDPYYGGDAGFERVLDLAEAAARGLLVHLRNR